MGEEVRMTEYVGGGGGGGGEEQKFMEWEDGLPSADDLTPLCQLLISPELASAFRITTELSRTMVDVNRASQNTLSSLSGGENDDLTTLECFDSRKMRKIVEEGDEVVSTEIEEADSRNGNCVADDSSGATKTVKRPRLVWTPQLHKRFVDVVTHLGIKNAVPKTIMQLMNVEGLTRENVASHLQKYRLYLKRMQDGPGPGLGPSDHLFLSTPVPQNLHDCGGHGQGQGQGQHQHASNGHMGMPIQMPYLSPPQMVPMPMIGMAAHGEHGLVGFRHGYNNMVQQQRDWSGNKFGSVAPYHHVARNDNK